MSQNTLENRYMEFLIDDQAFAIPLISVREVIQKPGITAVPNMPSHFEGMMNLRGKIIGVFDVRKKLCTKKVSEKVDAGPAVIIVIENSGISIGMVVDEVARVIHASDDMIKEAPLKNDDPTRKYIVNVIQTKERMILSLDVTTLFEIQKYKNIIAA